MLAAIAAGGALGAPREARLSRPAVEVLSLIAFRQPVTRAEIDSQRGSDSGALVRQLVRLGLIAVASDGTAYITRFGWDPWKSQDLQMASVLQVGPDGTARSIGPDLVVPNGVALSADEDTNIAGTHQ